MIFILLELLSIFAIKLYSYESIFTSTYFKLFSGSVANLFHFKIATNVNGTPDIMKGVPGDLFAATITFSNSGASPIEVFIDRYKNDIPAYWGVCYCYIQCHNIHQDTLTIEVQPFSSTNVTLQFKTDSVNPGVANDSFKIYQIGFAGISQTLNLTATTAIPVIRSSNLPPKVLTSKICRSLFKPIKIASSLPLLRRVV